MCDLQGGQECVAFSLCLRACRGNMRKLKSLVYTLVCM